MQFEIPFRICRDKIKHGTMICAVWVWIDETETYKLILPCNSLGLRSGSTRAVLGRLCNRMRNILMLEVKEPQFPYYSKGYR